MAKQQPQDTSMPPAGF